MTTFSLDYSNSGLFWEINGSYRGTISTEFVENANRTQILSRYGQKTKFFDAFGTDQMLPEKNAKVLIWLVRLEDT